MNSIVDLPYPTKLTWTISEELESCMDVAAKNIDK